MARRAARGNRLRSFVCGVDFSRHSRPALRCAAALASVAGARLTVLFVDDPLLVAAEARQGRNGESRGRRKTRAALARFVTTSLKGAADGVRCATAVGQAGPGIVRFVRRQKADLVIVGTRGIGGARALLFGSTTNYVVRHVRIPVLVVPAPRPSAL
ncbi:MAG: universal stress protein [Acidobacteria bacterium]|nr:universal stress protein [Acidobacteriota bacterium]